MNHGPLDDMHGKRENGRDADPLGGDAPGRAAGDALGRGDGLDGLRAALGGAAFGGSAPGTSGGGAPGGARGGGAQGGASGGEELDALGGDELALRRMLHNAVEDLAPSEGALDHLRKAVPARRARKRQALVGVAASVILLGTAVPAFVHVANTGGLSGDLTGINAGHGEEAQGGTGTETGGEDGEQGTGGFSGETPGSTGRADASETPVLPGSGTAPPSPGATAVPADSIPATTPTCASSQLGVDRTELGAPDSEGKVYGTFRIANVSGTECAVTGGGTVAVQAIGAADAAKISVVEHTAGDAASGLPDPASQAGALLLKPATAYEVKFAFVPSETCPTTGEPSPDPSPTDGASGMSDGAGTGATETQLGTEDGGGTADGSISVAHTPEAGAPVAETTIPNACAGTIYRTGVLSAP
ncbi:hypothetical protein [Streptomyces formicae]|uniref:hypothetical protein n=1 Tax=Streptomyces formicae TaxID=1616117 RepID=UPI001F561E5F|nr:hypothetical protein [Streptomyces formicae]